jgi:hypothetical protein
MSQTTYYFLAASQSFMESEPLDEVLEERHRRYQSEGQDPDFFYILQPAFLAAPELASVAAQIESPAAAVISTDPYFIRWLKVRLVLVRDGQFVAPSESIPDPFASLASNGAESTATE